MDKYLPKITGPALVLGAGGIGSEIVRALVAYGITDIAFTYGKNQASAEALKEEVEALGAHVYIGSLDLMNMEALDSFLDGAEAMFGHEISTVVNTVGFSPNTPLPDQTPEEWRQVFEINVFGPFFSSRFIASRMKERGTKGSITLITSTNGINSQSSISAHYDSSKAAQAMMMRILAEEYASAGIRINGVAPGWINTKMNDTLPEHERTKEMAKIWSGRFADPAEVAAFVVFVASTGGSYIYGQNLMIDGGYR